MKKKCVWLFPEVSLNTWKKVANGADTDAFSQLSVNGFINFINSF